MENKSKLPSMQICEQGSSALVFLSHFLWESTLLKISQTLIDEFCKKKTAKGWQGNEDIPQQPIRAAMTMVMMSAAMPLGGKSLEDISSLFVTCNRATQYRSPEQARAGRA
ncbi:MAG: hypothetical protein MUO63_12655 [Desulfobulbaceae bacterium]|nr:hypothetical protein [Desulfobulbaceae bacterium]